MNKKTCAYCKQRFTPIRSFQKNCLETACIEANNQKLREKKKKVNRKALKDFNASDKSKLKETAQKLINRYSRLRDQYENGYRCCTCGTTKGKMDGGHFLPTSGYSAIRYNTNQVHQQCVRCNQYRGGMPKEYRIFMVNKYGEAYVSNLESKKGVLRGYSVEYYQKLIRVVRKKTKRMELKLDAEDQ